jgi:hypothetical protein
MPDMLKALQSGFEGVSGSIARFESRVAAYVVAQQNMYRGVKHLRMPLMQATGASPFSMGESSGQQVGPEEGFAWCVTRLCIYGLTSGATPDVVNIFRGASLQEGGFLWQLNGNSPGSTFGNGELVLAPGDRLQVVSVGTFTSTAQITLSGEVNEVPAEMLAKLLMGAGT